MGVLADIREQIRLRLTTVQAEGVSPRVYGWDARGADLGPNAVTVGVPTSSFTRGDPLGTDVEVGRYGWLLSWPVTLYVARTGDDRATVILDALQQEVVEALMGAPNLAGTCIAASLEAASVDDTPDVEERVTSHHIVAWSLTTISFRPH